MSGRLAQKSMKQTGWQANKLVGRKERNKRIIWFFKVILRFVGAKAEIPLSGTAESIKIFLFVQYGSCD